MVKLHVAVFPHTDTSVPSDGAVLITCGGPGCSATMGPNYGFSFFVLPEIAQTRDLVFVDQRGVGLSQVINCPGFQQLRLGKRYADARACHRRLGNRADLYSTTDVADDLEDVRAALGYEEVDLFGGSYAGVDMLTYAIRHPDAVRSMVLSAPAPAVGGDLFFSESAEAIPGVVAGVCGRSPACAAAHPEPEEELATMARSLRHHPVTGWGVDTVGERHRMRVDEALLAQWILWFGGPHFLGAGEALPAFEAHRRGDSVPLLRLGADNDVAALEPAPLREFSEGHWLARTCVDQEMPWTKDAPAAVREREFADAYDAEPSRYGPFAKQSWAVPDLIGYQPLPCIANRWDHRPPYPAGTTVEGIPTLVLAGEYDVQVPVAAVQHAMDVVPDATLVTMTAAGHDPQFWSDCGPALVQEFFRDHELTDTSCAEEPAGGWWVPGSFPARVEQAPPATRTDGAPARGHLRRLATAVVWSVFDSLQHNFFVPGNSVGLRGGDVIWDPTPARGRWRLERVRFTRDLVVDGVASVGGPDRWVARLQVSERGRRPQEVRFVGRFWEDGRGVAVHLRDRIFTVPTH
jgi:pimeloyl-ACP methyl ester carboxylesterase